MILTRIRNLLTNQKGQSILEFALVLAPLIMLVMAVPEFGRYYNTKMVLQAAVREGARAGIVSKTPEITAENRTRNYLTANMTGGASPSVTASMPDGQGRGNRLVVKVTYNFPVIYAPIFNGKTSIPMTATIVFPQEDV